MFARVLVVMYECEMTFLNCVSVSALSKKSRPRLSISHQAGLVDPAILVSLAGTYGRHRQAAFRDRDADTPKAFHLGPKNAMLQSLSDWYDGRN